MTCELCGKECNDEFGDVDGAIVCATCLGWYVIDESDTEGDEDEIS